MAMLLEFSNVTKCFVSGFFRRSTLKAVDNISLGLDKGETLAVIGESGSGKSTLGRLALGLLEPSQGRVRFAGQNPARPACGQKALRRRLQAVFQDADGSLNPRLTARELLIEPLALHGLAPLDPEELLAGLLDLVHLTPDILSRRPCEISGGQRQRLGLARAMSLGPELLVADEPTASLDPSVQARILDILCGLKVRQGLACLYITHELATVRFIAERVAVLFAGHIVETGHATPVLDAPGHPYTRQLVAADQGSLDPDEADFETSESRISGCPFAPCCSEACSICRREFPPMYRLDDAHGVACHALANS